MTDNCLKHHRPNCQPCEAEWQARQDSEWRKNHPVRTVADLAEVPGGRVRRLCSESFGRSFVARER